MEKVKKFFNIGKIYENKYDSIQYLVQTVKELQVIKEHFSKCPLQTQKQADFELWIKVLDLIQNKEHLTKQGLQKIIMIRATINKGLTDQLKTAFPNIIPIERPCVINQEIKDPNWLAGFTSGEGCFYIESNTKLGISVQLIFQITQHNRDQDLMNSLISYFDCGYIKTKNKSQFTWLDFTVTKFSDINEKIIPFFNKYEISGVKLEYFKYWCKAAELIKNKAHLTISGLEKIRKIKAIMNKERRFFS